MAAMVSHALSWIRDGLGHSLDLSSPFCPWYLLPSALACGAWLLLSQRWSWRQVLDYIRQIFWKNRYSVCCDGLWALFQIVLLRKPVAWVHLTLFQWTYDGIMERGDDRFGIFYADGMLEAILATVVTMLAIDLAAYAVHRALHHWPFLWKIHRVHHQVEFLTPFSTFRQHPLEPFLLNGARGLAAGFALGLLHLFWPNCTPVWTLGGMGLGFFIYMFTVNLHHAPIPVRYPRPLRMFLISPHVHHIHHSRAAQHHGKNFGVVFSFWDRALGSYLDQDIELEELEFGL